MIICGYPCIGKTTWAERSGGKIIDLESSYFKIPGVNHNWEKNYCDLAISLSNNGSSVFVSTHKEVREYLLKNYPDAIVMFPSLDLKDHWIKRAKHRFDVTGLEKDLRAYERIRDYYEKDVSDLINSGLKTVTILDASYCDDSRTRLEIDEFSPSQVKDFERMLESIRKY